MARAGFGRNPMRRRIDRVEAVVVLVALVIALAVLPVALAVGHAVQARGLAASAAEMAGGHQVAAVLTETAPTGTDASGVVSPVLTAGRWRLPDGSVHTGLVWAPAGVAAGATVPVWLDSAGRPATEPITPNQAYWRGVLSVLGTMLTTIAVLVALLSALRWLCNRRRYRMWTREWDRIGPQWTTHRR